VHEEQACFENSMACFAARAVLELFRSGFAEDFIVHF
jgi:hypothetical protein